MAGPSSKALCKHNPSLLLKKVHWKPSKIIIIIIFWCDKDSTNIDEQLAPLIVSHHRHRIISMVTVDFYYPDWDIFCNPYY